MISLILTTLYLAKDTIHRWFTRLSSPIARVLVVYFLTLSALAALGSYVITLDIVRHELISRGADTVVATLSARDHSPIYVPSQPDIKRLLDAESYEIHVVDSAKTANGANVHVYTVDFRQLHNILPLMAPSGGPTLLQSAKAPLLPPGPSEVTIHDRRVPVMVRNLPEGHTLLRVIRSGAVFVTADRIPAQLYESASRPLSTVIFRVRHLKSSESVMRIERFINLLQRYEKLFASVISAGPLLQRMDDVLDKQVQCRFAFCLGISAIVGILLTALAGMEYRQNEYIYTLMKSFGIHPIMLVGTFIVENLLIVAFSFAAAIVSFMYFQRIIITQILKLGNYMLSLSDILPEIYLISYTLLGCVLVSAIPIFVAANREIGRVLK